MSNWEWKKLGDVCEFQGGAQPPKEEWIKENRSGYIRMLQIRDFTQSRNFDIEYVKKTSKLRICNENDILLGRYGASVGKVLTGLSGAYNVAIVKTIPNSEYSKLFIKYYFQSPLFQTRLLNLCNQRTAQAGFNKEDIYDFPIPYISLNEQKHVVKTLDEKFAKIDKLKTAAETNLKNAREIFNAELEQLFNPSRCHSERSVSVVEESRNDLPKGWEWKNLGDVCEITSALVDPKEKKYLNLYHVGGANIESETGKIVDLKTAEEEGLTSGKFVFDETMVLYNKIRPYLKKIARPKFSGLCSADMYPLSPKNNAAKDYLYYLLTTKNFTDYAILNSGRAGMPKVNRESLFAYQFPLPPLSEQKRIVAHLDKLSEKVKHLEEIYRRTIADCEELKKSILKQTFEG